MRILIVEDEPLSAKLIESIVKPYGDCHRVDNGDKAFDAFCDAYEGHEPFDLILLDIMMPEVSGQEALAAIRDYEKNNGIPLSEGVKVIMTTALDDPGNLYQAHREGCCEYLTKPIDKDKLIRTMKRVGLVVSH